MLLPKPQLNKLYEAICRNDVPEEAKFKGQETITEVAVGAVGERWGSRKQRDK